MDQAIAARTTRPMSLNLNIEKLRRGSIEKVCAPPTPGNPYRNIRLKLSRKCPQFLHPLNRVLSEGARYTCCSKENQSYSRLSFHLHRSGQFEKLRPAKPIISMNNDRVILNTTAGDRSKKREVRLL
jgi:hypothetical protein